jgi:hypothetical protein
MAVPCIAPLPYPNCTDHVSLFTTAVFVLTTLSPKRCFYPEATKGCTMPTNLTEANGFYPVQPSMTGNFSEYHGELAVSGRVNLTIPQAVSTVYVQDGAAGELHVLKNNVQVIGMGDHAFDRIVVDGQNVTVSNITAAELHFPASVYTNLQLSNLTVQNPLQFAPQSGATAVEMGNSVLTDIRGNAVTLLHPRGTVEINGPTEVLLLLQGGQTPFRTTGTSTAILDVGRLTGIFGEQYLVEFEAGELVVEALEAEELAQRLVVPTVIAVVSVVLAWGDRLRG